MRPYMDFIERWFGISPDGGNGTTELVCIAFILAAGAVFAFRGQILDFARRRFNIPYRQAHGEWDRRKRSIHVSLPKTQIDYEKRLP